MTNLQRRMQHKRLQGLCTKIVNNTVCMYVVCMCVYIRGVFRGGRPPPQSPIAQEIFALFK